MKICVLQADYSPTSVDYKNYDPPRDLTAILSGHTVHHILLNKLTTYRQLKELSTQGFDVFVNLCDGYFEWEIPSIDVMETLERLGLPYTGPTPALYHVPKPLMKYVAYTAGVATPAHALVVPGADSIKAVEGLRFPLFVKPSHAGDSLGVDDASLVHDATALVAKVQAINTAWGEALVEEYIAGRELTVLVVASPDEGGAPTALMPVEFVFPPGLAFKTYATKTSDLHPDANIPVRDERLAARLKAAAETVFSAFGGMGYARMDFRLNNAGELFFLEVNFTCSVFYSGGLEGAADYILNNDPIGRRGFAERIMAEGIARHRRKHRPYAMRGNSVNGYGIFATEAIAAGQRVFRMEGKPHRIVTASHARTWSPDDQVLFRRYAVPVSDQAYAIWSLNPEDWAPQNHSCDANTAFDGLDVVAIRAIGPGEELTLDYATFMDDTGEPFDCTCRSPNCRGRIAGTKGNSVTSREYLRGG